MISDGKDFYPLRISKEKREEIINLLLISEGDKKHYCLIKNLRRLLSSEVSINKEAKFFCVRCVNNFPSKEKLKIQEEYCLTNEAVKIEMPEEGSEVKFKNYNRAMKISFVV